MRNTLKRVLSITLAGMMLASVATVAVSANSGEKTRVTFQQACEEQWNDLFKEEPLETVTYMFYMPDEWKNDYNDYYDGKDPSTYAAGIYWWGTRATPEDCNLMDKGWPGYAVTEKAPDCDNVYVAQVPTSATAVIWNNLVDGGTDNQAEEYTMAIQSGDIEVGGYQPNMDPYGFYANGLDTMDGMIFVCNPEDTSVSPSSGKLSYEGEWFYYYGNGEYGYAPTREEAGNNVFSNGEFPPSGLTVSKTAFKPGIGGTESCKTNKANAEAKSENTAIATVEKVKDGSFVVTGVAEGTTNIVFESFNNKTFETNTVTVPVTVTKPSFDSESVSVKVGGSADNIFYGVGENVTISYSKNGYVTYDGYSVEAKKAGVVTVYCKQGGKSFSFKVTAKPAVSPSSKSLKAGQTVALKVKGGKATFSSNNKKVATVSKSGVVTALKSGKVTIAVKVNGVTTNATIKVTSNPSIKSSVNAKVKKNTNVAIKGAASKSQVKVSKCKIAKITVSKTKLSIKGTKKGKQTITVTINGVAKKVRLTVK